MHLRSEAATAGESVRHLHLPAGATSSGTGYGHQCSRSSRLQNGPSAEVAGWRRPTRHWQRRRRSRCRASWLATQMNHVSILTSSRLPTSPSGEPNSPSSPPARFAYAPLLCPRGRSLRAESTHSTGSRPALMQCWQGRSPEHFLRACVSQGTANYQWEKREGRPVEKCRGERRGTDLCTVRACVLSSIDWFRCVGRDSTEGVKRVKVERGTVRRGVSDDEGEGNGNFVFDLRCRRTPPSADRACVAQATPRPEPEWRGVHKQ